MSQASHLKVSYNKATDSEIKESEKIILNTFRAEDITLKRTYAVKRGLASAVRSFYIQDSDDPKLSKNLLPVGFLPWLKQYYDESGLEYEHIEMRKWPSVDKEFAHQLADGKIVCFQKSDTILQIDNYLDEDILEIQVDDEFYNFLRNNNFI